LIHPVPNGPKENKVSIPVLEESIGVVDAARKSLNGAKKSVGWDENTRDGLEPASKGRAGVAGFSSGIVMKTANLGLTFTDDDVVAVVLASAANAPEALQVTHHGDDDDDDDDDDDEDNDAKWRACTTGTKANCQSVTARACVRRTTLRRHAARRGRAWRAGGRPSDAFRAVGAVA
jgi:hypothetical protein